MRFSVVQPRDRLAWPTAESKSSAHARVNGVGMRPQRLSRPSVTGTMPRGGDFKPQYVCALVFVVRVAGMVGSALTVPTGTSSMLLHHVSVAVVFVLLNLFYVAVALAFVKGRLDAFVERRSVVVIDLAMVAAINIWASHMAPTRHLDVGGNDLFWMAAIGSIALWGAVHGRTLGIALMSVGGGVLIAMSLANGFAPGDINWAFVLSRLVFVGIGLMATASGLHISEVFEEYRRKQWLRAGEEQALGAMHRRALQDLKVISRLASENGAPEERLRDIKNVSNSLSDYVRSWPRQHDPSLSIDEAIERAVFEVDPGQTIEVRMTGAARSSFPPADVLTAIGDAVSEATRNVVQHGQTKQASVRATIEATHISVVIQDSGPGFDAEVVSHESSRLGLRRIIDTMEGIGGSAILATSPGRGCTWTLQVDLDSVNPKPRSTSLETNT